VRIDSSAAARHLTIPVESRGIDAAVHLAGAPITTRWSPKRLSASVRAASPSATSLRARRHWSAPSVLVSGWPSASTAIAGRKCSMRRVNRARRTCRSLPLWEQSTEPATRRHPVVTIRTASCSARRGADEGSFCRVPSSSSALERVSATAASGRAGSRSTTKSPSFFAPSTTLG